jgi:hypothetical protein
MTKQFGFLVFQPEKKPEVFQQFFPSAGVLHRAHSLKEFDRESRPQHCVLAIDARRISGIQHMGDESVNGKSSGS